MNHSFIRYFRDNKAFSILTLILLISFLLIKGPTYLELWNNLAKKPMYGADFFGNFYIRAVLIKTGKFDVYDDKLLTENLTALGLPNTHLSFYPPFAYLVHLPFAFLNLKAAIKLYFILNHLWLYLSIFVIFAALPVGSPGKAAIRALPVFLLLLPASFIIDILNLGQLDIFILLLFSLFIFFYVRKKFLPACLFLALAINLKVYPAVFIIIFFFRKEWVNLAWTAVFTAIFNLPFLFLGDPIRTFPGFIRILAKTSTFHTSSIISQSLSSAFFRLMNIRMPATVEKSVNYFIILAVLCAASLLIYNFLKKEKILKLTEADHVFWNIIITMLPVYIYLLGASYAQKTYHILLLVFIITCFAYLIREKPGAELYFLLFVAWGFIVFDGEIGIKKWQIITFYYALYYNVGTLLVICCAYLNSKILDTISQ